MRASQLFKRILRDNRGATAIEYGLILALICLFILATMKVMAESAATPRLETARSRVSRSPSASG